jgi:hypothetical protein
MSTIPGNAVSPRLAQLVRKLGNEKYRTSYLTTRLKTFLANQIRALRGNASQAEFGKHIGKPQSVVSRIEDPEYGNLSIQTLLEIAQKLKLALIIQFVDWPTFLRFTEETASKPLAPDAFDQAKIDALIAPQAVTATLPSQFGNNLVSAATAIGTIVWGDPERASVYAFASAAQHWKRLQGAHYGTYQGISENAPTRGGAVNRWLLYQSQFEDLADVQALDWPSHQGQSIVLPALPGLSRSMGRQ